MSPESSSADRPRRNLDDVLRAAAPRHRIDETHKRELEAALRAHLRARKSDRRRPLAILAVAALICGGILIGQFVNVGGEGNDLLSIGKSKSGDDLFENPGNGAQASIPRRDRTPEQTHRMAEDMLEKIAAGEVELELVWGYQVDGRFLFFSNYHLTRSDMTTGWTSNAPGSEVGDDPLTFDELATVMATYKEGRAIPVGSEQRMVDGTVLELAKFRIDLPRTGPIIFYIGKPAPVPQQGR